MEMIFDYYNEKGASIEDPFSIVISKPVWWFEGSEKPTYRNDC